MKLTAAAAEHLALHLDRIGRPDIEETCFRMTLNAYGQLLIVPGTRERGDVTFHHGDRPVLAAPPEIASDCRRCTLDVAEGENGVKQFRLFS